MNAVVLITLPSWWSWCLVVGCLDRSQLVSSFIYYCSKYNMYIMYYFSPPYIFLVNKMMFCLLLLYSCQFQTWFWRQFRAEWRRPQRGLSKEGENHTQKISKISVSRVKSLSFLSITSWSQLPLPHHLPFLPPTATLSPTSNLPFHKILHIVLQ